MTSLTISHVFRCWLTSIVIILLAFSFYHVLPSSCIPINDDLSYRRRVTRLRLIDLGGITDVHLAMFCAGHVGALISFTESVLH